MLGVLGLHDINGVSWSYTPHRASRGGGGREELLADGSRVGPTEQK